MMELLAQAFGVATIALVLLLPHDKKAYGLLPVLHLDRRPVRGYYP